MSVDLNSKDGRKKFIESNFNDLLNGINNTYGTVILNELMKRIELTISEFNNEINNAFSELKVRNEQRKKFYNKIDEENYKESKASKNSKTEWEEKLDKIESKK